MLELMHATPVTYPIMFITKNERRHKTIPKTANINVFLALSILFASAFEVMNFIPAIIIKITATAPASISAQLIIVAITGNMQSRVATETPLTVVPQLAIIIKRYQKGKYKSRPKENI